MKHSSLLAILLGLAVIWLSGCQLPPETESRPPRVYLMLVVPEGMVPQDLPARREQIIRYLLESGLLRSREDLVSDAAQADRTIRATLLDDGFKLEFLNPSTGRVVGYEPVEMPDDYYFYEGLIFYGTAGSAHRRHPHDDDDRRHPPPATPPGHRDDDEHRKPQPGTPDHPTRPPGHDRTDDHPRTQPPPQGTPPPRTTPPPDRPHSPLPPGPSNNRPKYKDDRPTRDDRPAPREHPHNDDNRRKDDDRPKQDAPRPATTDSKPDNGVVPAR
jgi:hypothetical protein